MGKESIRIRGSKSLSKLQANFTFQIWLYFDDEELNKEGLDITVIFLIDNFSYSFLKDKLKTSI